MSWIINFEPVMARNTSSLYRFFSDSVVGCVAQVLKLCDDVSEMKEEFASDNRMMKEKREEKRRLRKLSEAREEFKKVAEGIQSALSAVGEIHKQELSSEITEIGDKLQELISRSSQVADVDCVCELIEEADTLKDASNAVVRRSAALIAKQVVVKSIAQFCKDKDYKVECSSNGGNIFIDAEKNNKRLAAVIKEDNKVTVDFIDGRDTAQTPGEKMGCTEDMREFERRLHDCGVDLVESPRFNLRKEIHEERGEAAGCAQRGGK